MNFVGRLSEPGSPQLISSWPGAVKRVTITTFSRSTLERMQSARQLPAHLKIRGRVVWKRSEIMKWIDAGCPHQDEWEQAKKAAKAAEMASEEIDRLGDVSATDEERQLRKRRLIRGPKEFLDLRRNRPKANG